jgi:tetratricopeptide (TPR) repeat protein
MRTRFRAALLAAAIGLAGAGTSACNYLGTLKAQMAFKDANAAYQTQDYKKAIEKYKEALQHKPDLAVAYFYLGNSYDNLYKPARKGEPANDANLTEAVNYYRKATETIEDPKLRKLSYEYLLNSYGAEKLNDPTQAEPIVRKMIEMEPDEPSNYYALAKIYEDAGNYEEAEKMLIAARDRRPKDSTTYMQLAGFYNPEAYYTIATYLWDKTFRDFRLKDAEKRTYVEKGIEATDKAIAIKDDYLEAIVYKGLLLRLQANLEKDRAKQQALLREADALRDRAKALQKAKQAGAGA